MTSLEIAELTGKQHNHLMRDIRKMEIAWEKVTQSKFGLSTYQDRTGRTLPCYSLTKIECLYIATKFNDEARAKLVLRGEELERTLPQPLRGGEKFLPSPRELLKIADKIIGAALSKVNEAAENTLTATQMAKTTTSSQKLATLLHGASLQKHLSMALTQLTKSNARWLPPIC